MEMIAHHLGMLVSMWVVLIAIAVSIVVRIVTGLRTSTKIAELAEIVTRPILLDVLPLVLLSLITVLDPTHILVRIWYYVAAALIVLRELLLLGKKVKLR